LQKVFISIVRNPIWWAGNLIRLHQNPPYRYGFNSLIEFAEALHKFLSKASVHKKGYGGSQRRKAKYLFSFYRCLVL